MTPSFTTFSRFGAIVLLAACLIGGSRPASADTFTLVTSFDTTFDDTLTPAYIGSGTFSYDGVSALSDGSYDWSSFTNLNLQLMVNNFTFTQSDLNTPFAGVNVEIRGGFFFFSSDNANGAGGGAQNGSADFSNGADYITTQPYVPGSGPFGGVGGMSTPLYTGTIEGVNFGGTYGVVTGAPVPEPATFAYLLTGAIACAAMLRRTRRRN